MTSEFKSERREAIVRNHRKMGVTGRSTLMLLNLPRQAANRRRVRRLSTKGVTR